MPSITKQLSNYKYQRVSFVLFVPMPKKDEHNTKFIYFLEINLGMNYSHLFSLIVHVEYLLSYCNSSVHTPSTVRQFKNQKKGLVSSRSHLWDRC